MKAEWWHNRRVVIAGGAGCIGSHLADRLWDQVSSLTIVDGLIPGTGGRREHVERILGSDHCRFLEARIEDVDQWSEVLAETDVVFMFASVNAHKESLLNPEQDAQRNLWPHLIFSTRLRRLSHPIHVVFASSRSIYGRIVENPVPESAAKNPLDFYSLHTWVAEHYYRLAVSSQVAVTCLRFSNVYGPRQRLGTGDIGLWGEILRNAILGQPVKVYKADTSSRDSLYVSDVVDAFIRAGEEGSGFATYNVGGRSIAVADFCRAIQMVIPGFAMEEADMPEHLKAMQTGNVLLDARAFSERFDWKPSTELNEGIRKTLEFFIENKHHYL